MPVIARRLMAIAWFGAIWNPKIRIGMNRIPPPSPVIDVGMATINPTNKRMMICIESIEISITVDQRSGIRKTIHLPTLYYNLISRHLSQMQY